METTKIAVFRGRQIRRHWDDNRQIWSFSAVDVISALTDSENPAVYWRVLKKRLKDEGADQTVTKCNAFKMTAADGKARKDLESKTGKKVVSRQNYLQLPQNKKLLRESRTLTNQRM